MEIRLIADALLDLGLGYVARFKADDDVPAFELVEHLQPMLIKHAVSYDIRFASNGDIMITLVGRERRPSIRRLATHLDELITTGWTETEGGNHKELIERFLTDIKCPYDIEMFKYNHSDKQYYKIELQC